MKILPYQTVKDKIIHVREQDVMLDYIVAELYGVETREINQAVKNNPNKFPKGYVFELDRQEVTDLRSKNLIATSSKSRVNPKAFTEKGLYMLATILTSKQAIATTIAIVEAFQKIKNLSRVIKQLPEAKTKQEQQNLMQKSGEIIAEILDDALESDESETTIELNLAVLKFKHTIKKKKS